MAPLKPFVRVTVIASLPLVPGATVSIGAAMPRVKPSTKTLKDCVTEVAGLLVALPDWAAMRVQLPADSRVAVAPVTVHTDGVEDVYVTGNPELAVAVKASVDPAAWLEMPLKVMVCGAGTIKLNTLERVMLPDVPVTVIGTVPGAIAAGTETCSVVPVVELEGLKLLVAPLGKLDAVKLTVPEKPLLALTVIPSVPLLPGSSVSVEPARVSPNDAGVGTRSS